VTCLRLYADSSFLVSCYLPDLNTAQAGSYLAELDLPLPFTPLRDLEVRNALRLGVFRGVLTAEQMKAAVANLDADLRAKRLVRTTLRWSVVFRLASRLSGRHAVTTGTRSLDILHVAAAKGLRLKEFTSFDARQRALATAAGLTDALARD
jgi:predicted nucleic acid-binding protein